eukprot:436173_1
MSLLLVTIYTFVVTAVYGTNIGKSTLLKEAVTKYGAVCLDGSPGNYYFAQNSQTTKYVLFFQGGGECFNEAGCWSRRNGTLGSTKSDPLTMDMNEIGFLGNDSKTSPLFYNWNKIFMRYCDGASYSGNVLDPIINPNNASMLMYYRGKRLLNALFESLLSQFGLAKATDFVIGGGSAGGLSVFIHSNYIADNFFNLSQTKLVSMPDVGFFLEYNGWNGMTQFATKNEHLYNMQNVSSSIVDPICFSNKNLNASECIFAQNVAGNIKIPTFILNSQYDSAQANDVLGTGNSNATLLNEYGQNFTRILINLFLDNNNLSGNIYGAYIDSCYHHDAQNPKYWSGLNIDGYTQATAFQQFYNGLGKSNNRLFWYQNETYPCQICCPTHQ